MGNFYFPISRQYLRLAWRAVGNRTGRARIAEGLYGKSGGSAAGVLVYSLLAFLHTPPPVWLIVGFASLFPFYKKPWQIATMCICVALTFSSLGNSIWSPYYRIEIAPYMSKTEPAYRLGTNLLVNRVFSFQRTIDLSDRMVKEHPDLKLSPEYVGYNIPYDARPGAKNVLVLGAGSGNDVAAALRHGAQHVDAVEIDPEIRRLGISEHPEKPYSNLKRKRFHK